MPLYRPLLNTLIARQKYFTLNRSQMTLTIIFLHSFFLYYKVCSNNSGDIFMIRSDAKKTLMLQITYIVIVIINISKTELEYSNFTPADDTLLIVGIISPYPNLMEYVSSSVPDSDIFLPYRRYFE